MSDTRAIQHLDETLPRSRFQFGEYISEGFDIWKRNAGLFIGFGLLFILMILVINLIPIIGTIAGSVLISPALMLGAYIVSHRTLENENPAFGQFFDGFQFAKEIIVAYLIMMVIYLILLIPFIFFMGTGMVTWYMEAMSDPMTASGMDPPDINLWGLLALIPMIYVGVCFYYVVHFIGFYKLTALDAIKYSFKYVNKHWFLVFLFLIVVGLIAMSGLIALVIGVFITITFMFPMLYSSFRGMTELDTYYGEDTDSNIIESLVEN